MFILLKKISFYYILRIIVNWDGCNFEFIHTHSANWWYTQAPLYIERCIFRVTISQNKKFNRNSIEFLSSLCWTLAYLRIKHVLFISLNCYWCVGASVQVNSLYKLNKTNFHQEFAVISELKEIFVYIWMCVWVFVSRYNCCAHLCFVLPGFFRMCAHRYIHIFVNILFSRTTTYLPTSNHTYIWMYVCTSVQLQKPKWTTNHLHSLISLFLNSDLITFI